MDPPPAPPFCQLPPPLSMSRHASLLHTMVGLAALDGGSPSMTL